MGNKSTELKELPKTPKELFEYLRALDVSEHLEKKNVTDKDKKQLSYLSWAWAWDYFKKVCPDATYEVKKFGENNLPYVYDETVGYMVFTSVTACGQTHEMWLPVMDDNNNAVKKERYQTVRYGEPVAVYECSMFDINKAIMRCLVKNLAMFGLGLYIYSGEDLPGNCAKPTPTTVVQIVQDLDEPNDEPDPTIPEELLKKNEKKSSKEVEPLPPPKETVDSKNSPKIVPASTEPAKDSAEEAKKAEFEKKLKDEFKVTSDRVAKKFGKTVEQLTASDYEQAYKMMADFQQQAKNKTSNEADWAQAQN